MVDLRGEAKARHMEVMFARIAPRYDFMNTVMSGGGDRRWRRWAARVAAQGLEGPALDVCTGSGELALEVARCPTAAPVVGVDLAAPMLDRARAKARRRQMDGRVLFLQGEALNLPFSDAAFACATCGFSLRNMPDLPQALKEMVRVVRPGGRVVTLEMVPEEIRGPLSPLIGFHFRTVIPFLGALLGGDRDAYTYLSHSIKVFSTASQLAGLMEASGLADVTYRTLALGTVALHWGTRV